MLKKAKAAVDKLFFVGLQEVYDLSVDMLLREFQIKLDIKLPKERSESSKGVKEGKKQILADKNLIKKARLVNAFDVRLYRYGKSYCTV